MTLEDNINGPVLDWMKRNNQSVVQIMNPKTKRYIKVKRWGFHNGLHTTHKKTPKSYKNIPIYAP